MNEPSMEELKNLRRKLYGSESTYENLQKIKAIEAQIGRREKGKLTADNADGRG